MNVACQECRSVFRVDPAKVPAGGVRARCSVCGAVMRVEAPATFGEDAWSARPAAAEPSHAPGRPAGQTPGAAAPAVHAARRTPVFPPAPLRPSVATPAASPAIAGGQLATTATPVSQARVGATPAATPVGAVTAPARQTGLAGLPASGPASSGPVAGRSTPAGFPSRTPAAGVPSLPASALAPAPASVFAAAPAPAPAMTPSAAHAPAPRVAAPVPGAPSPAATDHRAPINPFLANDPNQKAKRLARALVSDIVAYHPQQREQGLREGTLRQLFKDEIKKSYEEYVEQVGKEFADGTGHFQDALNEILAGGRRMF